MPAGKDPKPGTNDAQPPGLYRMVIRRLARTVPVERAPFLRGQAVALACVALATLLRLVLDPVLTATPYVTFFPAVLIASIWGGTRAGLSALILAFIASSVLWLDPPGRPSFDAAALWTAATFWVFGSVLLAVASMLRDLLRALVRSEKRAQMLADEMGHRVENFLATAVALARQTARGATSVEEHVQLFEARMAALGRARKLAAAAPAGEAELRDLAEGVLAPFETARFDIAGPAARVPESLATVLALALHELATNALKYGALSRPGGRVALRWSRRDGRVELVWNESGGPPVAEPDRSGFGTRMIRDAFASQGAESDIRFAPDGLRCRIAFAEAAEEGAHPVALDGAARPART